MSTEATNAAAQNAIARLAELQPAAPLAEVLDFYDSLPVVTVEEVIGNWYGSGLETDNPLDGVLEATGWYGKNFTGPDGAHPLVFDGPRGKFRVNPRAVPLGTALRIERIIKAPGVLGLARRLLPLLRTTKPAARLRMTEYRGVVTATMCYDALPIHDVFRKVDDHTLLGAMDMRGLKAPFMFVLRREGVAA